MAWVQRWASGEQNPCCWAADICPGSFTCMQPSSPLAKGNSIQSMRCVAYSLPDMLEAHSLTVCACAGSPAWPSSAASQAARMRSLVMK